MLCYVGKNKCIIIIIIIIITIHPSSMSSFSVMMVPFFFIYSKSMNFFSELHVDPKTSAVSLSDDDTRLSLFLDYGS